MKKKKEFTELYTSPAFLNPPTANATPAAIIPRAKNKGVKPSIVEAAPVTFPFCAFTTSSATVPIKFTPIIMTINPPIRFPNIHDHFQRALGIR